MSAGPNRSTALAVTVLAVATLLAYHNSFHGPFVFDDRAAILENPSIRRLSALGEILAPPVGGQSASGRPLLNLSLAINYAIGGSDPWGYHVVNVIIHFLGGLTLFGIVRRTLALRPWRGSDPTLLGAAVAALWLLHPLQTAAVTYVVQRAESLMGLFYLLTWYLFIRGVESSRPWRWFAAAAIACLAGMATKEVMVTAPLLILLYDRTFVAGGWVEAWRRRRGFYLALAGTWVLLAVLLLRSGDRGGTVGLGLGVSSGRYFLTQCEAVVTYLKLGLWPKALVFDYGEYAVRDVVDAAPQVLLMVALLGATIVALVRRPAIGFLGAGFFLILAPTSSVVPITSQTIAEHRMYLPSAALVAAWVLGAHALLARRAWVPLLGLALALGALTFGRNRTYRTEIALWTDSGLHRPGNIRAHLNLGSALLDANRLAEAADAFARAQRLRPNVAEVEANLCQLYARLGRFAEAVAHGEAAIRLQPANADARINLAAALVQLGRTDEAIEHYAVALRTQPEAADLKRALADVLVIRAQSLAREGDLAQANRRVGEALQAAPDHVEAHFMSGNLAAAQRDFPRAIASYRHVLQLAPAHLAARNNLANVYLVLGRASEAVGEYREILRLRPEDKGVQENLQQALEMQRRRR